MDLVLDNIRGLLLIFFGVIIYGLQYVGYFYF